MNIPTSRMSSAYPPEKASGVRVEAFSRDEPADEDDSAHHGRQRDLARARQAGPVAVQGQRGGGQRARGGQQEEPEPRLVR
ncbi:hypothetical protein [Streptomyces sp. NPDC001292]|uniref:hypothetical protein n=1 Tax=Streptomyces sp. NPDC001292 TaxID=3364558 RepID=UPI0036D187B8